MVTSALVDMGTRVEARIAALERVPITTGARDNLVELAWFDAGRDH